MLWTAVFKELCLEFMRKEFRVYKVFEVFSSEVAPAIVDSNGHISISYYYLISHTQNS